jgi:hypothetical protein
MIVASAPLPILLNTIVMKNVVTLDLNTTQMLQ